MSSAESLHQLMLTCEEWFSGLRIPSISMISYHHQIFLTVSSQLGFHLGRPFRTNMEDVTVGKPNKTRYSRSNNWFPYVSPDSVYAGSGVPDHMDAICEEQINLCEIMAPCGDFL